MFSKKKKKKKQMEEKKKIGKENEKRGDGIF